MSLEDILLENMALVTDSVAEILFQVMSKSSLLN